MLVERKKLPFANKLERKKYVSIFVTDKPVKTFGTWWDGGSKYTYTGMSPTGQTVPLEYTDEVRNLQFGHQIKNAIVRPGVIVVKSGTSCGKPATVTLYVHPDDIGALGDDIRREIEKS